MIRSFGSGETEKIFRRERSRRFDAIARIAKRKLDHLHAAVSLTDFAAVPGRDGQYSIRINEQWRICFEWKDGEAFAVEIVDYH